jgi:hypothetical protein
VKSELSGAEVLFVNEHLIVIKNLFQLKNILKINVF